MRIAIFGDIHGNTVALRGVLEAIDDRDVDLIVCLGDLAANGPDPAGAVETIADLGCLVVAGNTDADMVSVPEWWADPAAVGAPETVFPVVELSLWCARQLTDDHRAFLAGLPPTVELELGSARSLLAFHGSPRSATDVINATTRGDELVEMLNALHTICWWVGIPMCRWCGTLPGSFSLTRAASEHPSPSTGLRARFRCGAMQPLVSSASMPADRSLWSLQLCRSMRTLWPSKLAAAVCPTPIGGSDSARSIESRWSW